MKLFRVMKVDADGKPRVGIKGYMLGVRPSDPTNTHPRRRPDVAAVNPTDTVSPGEGLSTSIDPGVLTAGSGEGLFEVDTADLGPALHENPDHPPHCLLQPTAPMTLGAFQRALEDTRDSWVRV